MALSTDIRGKVLKAIKRGMSCRQPAARFDIGPATAVRWVKRVEITADAAPSKMGGDHRSQRIEAHAEFILGQLEEKATRVVMSACPSLRNSKFTPTR